MSLEQQNESENERDNKTFGIGMASLYLASFLLALFMYRNSATVSNTVIDARSLRISPFGIDRPEFRLRLSVLLSKFPAMIPVGKHDRSRRLLGGRIMTERDNPGPEYDEMMNDLNRKHGLPYSEALKVNGFNVIIDVPFAAISDPTIVGIIDKATSLLGLYLSNRNPAGMRRNRFT